MYVPITLNDITTWFGEFTPLRLQQIAVGVIGALALIGLIFAFLRMRRRILHNRVIEKSRSQADIALRTIRSRLNYSIQLLNNERDLAKYDKVRFSDDDARYIVTQLQVAEQQYNQVQSALDQAIQTIPAEPSHTDYEQLANFISSLLPTIPTIERIIQDAIQHRSKIDGIIQQHSQDIDRVKQLQQQLVQRFNQLGLTPKLIMRGVDTYIEQAQALLAHHDYKNITTITNQGGEHIVRINTVLDQLHDTRNGVSMARKAAEKAGIQGFDIAQSQFYIAEATRQLDDALAALLNGQIATCEQSLQQAEIARNHAVAYGGNLPALQQRNGEVLAQLQQRLGQLPSTIKVAHTAVHQLHPIADQHWIDIRHAGSDALIHVRYAQYYLNLAHELNQNSPHLQQDIANNIDIGQRSLKRGERILTTIHQRQLSIAQLSDVARAEFADAEELMDRMQIHIATDTGVNAVHYAETRSAYERLQAVVDTVPFDPIACFNAARTFVDQITQILPIETSELTISTSQRVGRLRTILIHCMAILEQSQTLIPRRIPSTIAQGLQSIRHEISAFDAKYRTASDVTVPIVTELHTLTKQYTRLITAIQHFQAQLLDYQAQTVRDLDTAHPILEQALQRLTHAMDAQALQQLHQIDEQWYNRLLNVGDACTQITHITPDSDTALGLATPPTYVYLRGWGKAFYDTPDTQFSWAHTEPLSLHW
jgi:hypothetical protein